MSACACGWPDSPCRGGPPTCPAYPTPTDNEPTLVRVTLVLCTLCLSGAGGQCHVPGCALWMKSAPDVPIAPEGEQWGALADLTMVAVAVELVRIARALGKSLDEVTSVFEEGISQAEYEWGETE